MTLVPMWLPKLVAVSAGAIYVLASDASRRARLLVVVAVLLSLVLQHAFDSSAAWTAGLLFQVAVSVFVLIHLKVLNAWP